MGRVHHSWGMSDRKLRGLCLNRAAELVETAVEETLTYYAFPEEHWRRIRTTDVFDNLPWPHAALLPFRSAAFPQPRLEGGFSFHPKTKCRYSDSARSSHFRSLSRTVLRL